MLSNREVPVFKFGRSSDILAGILPYLMLATFVIYLVDKFCTDKKKRQNLREMNKMKTVRSSNVNHQHTRNRSATVSLFDPSRNSKLEQVVLSDSDDEEISMISDSEHDATPEPEEKLQQKPKNAIPPRKNRRGGFNVHKSNSLHSAPAPVRTTSPSLFPSCTIIIASTKTVLTLAMMENGVAAPIKKQNEIIGDMTVNSRLLKKLSIEHKDILFNLWKSGDVVEFKGESGYVFRKKNAKKNPQLRVKAKEHGVDPRFFAIHRSGGRPNQFCLTAYQKKHGLPVKMVK